MVLFIDTQPLQPTLGFALFAGGYDVRLRENVEVLEELKQLAKDSGVEEDVVFVPSFTQTQKALLLTASICVLYTPEVRLWCRVHHVLSSVQHKVAF
jgi:hypothetical protein